MENTELNKSSDTNPQIKFDIKKYSMIIILIVTWIVLSILTQNKFLTARNLSNLFRAMAVTAVLATGMFSILVAGHIDLSLGSLCGLTGGIAAVLQVQHSWGTPAAICAALAVGALAGAWHGFWVAFKKVPAFIVTLGSLLGLRGILMLVTKGVTIAPLKKSFTVIGQAYVPPAGSWIIGIISMIGLIIMTMKKRESRIRYGFKVPAIGMEVAGMVIYCALIAVFVFVMNMYEGIPVPVLIVVVLSLLFVFITSKTQFGRQVFAMGGNMDAARLSGINVRARTFAIFVLSGLLAGLAGVILTARINAATTTAGNMYEMDAVASCVIGGTSLMGGEGHVAGAVVGALVMASLDNGMSLMNADAAWQYVVKGLVLILAVWVDIETKKKKA